MKKNFIYECKNENINLPNQCKGENVFLDTIIDIHNPLSSKLTNTHNSIRNEVFLKFNLKDLQIKTFDEFIIDPLSSNFRKQKIKKIKNKKIKINIYIYISVVVGIGKSQIIKAISTYLKKRHSHDMLKISAFTTSATLLIGGSTIHSLIGLSFDQNIDS